MRGEEKKVGEEGEVMRHVNIIDITKCARSGQLIRSPGSGWEQRGWRSGEREKEMAHPYLINLEDRY